MAGKRLLLVAMAIVAVTHTLRAQCQRVDPCQYYAVSAAVFVGTVQSITAVSASTEGSDPDWVRVRLSVNEAFRAWPVRQSISTPTTPTENRTSS